MLVIPYNTTSNKNAEFIHEVLGTPCGKKTIIHPVAGKMIMDHITLQVYDAPELKVTIYQPRQENETEEKMEQLLR
ncbi:hypothetical protein ACFVSZ_00255 [Priestia megaterium]|uniref:MmyB family transcriptional regulator n=1 Tax=Priestia megaterium TaxID=1404 RepID=UPI002E1DA80D